MKKTLRTLLAFAAVLTMTLTAVPFPARAASGGCISELCLASGEDAVNQLEKSGYSVLYQNLNVGTEDDERLYLGYKLGGNPITDIAVGFQYVSGMTIGSSQYAPVSDISLNKGTLGVPLYLYCTHDSSAGSPIVSLTTLTCGEENSSAVYPMLGDGSEAVRTESGDAADLDLGIAGPELYLMKIRSGLCMPYIKDVKVVTASSEREALRSVVRAGCNYRVEGNLSVHSDTYTYLCYNRTATPSEALTMLTASTDGGTVVRNGVTMASVPGKIDSDTDLYICTSSDPALGNPITDIASGKLMGPQFTLGDWAMMYFSGAASSALSQVYSEDFYYELLSDTTEYTEIPVDLYTEGHPAGQSPLTIITAKAGLEEKLAAAYPSGNVSDSDGNPVNEPEDCLTVGDARDEFNPLAGEKRFDDPNAPDAPAYLAGTAEALAMMKNGANVSDSDFAGSTFGSGSETVSGFVPALAVLLAGCAVIVYIVKRNTAERSRGESGEKSGEKEEAKADEEY